MEVDLRDIRMDKAGVVQPEIFFGDPGVMHQFMPLFHPKVLGIGIVVGAHHAKFSDAAADVQDPGPLDI